MAESIVSDLAGRLIESLGKYAAEKIAPYFGGRQKFNELHQTMRLIEARLVDAERHHEGDRGKLIKEWLRSLKRVMYQFEDLLEEVAYSEKKDMSPSSSKLTKLVRYLPSKLNALSMNKTIAQEVDDIMSELICLKNDMASLHLEVVPQPTLNLLNTRETSSFVREDTIVGRNEDRDVIVDMILNSYHVNRGALLVVPIVGMGGLGKTALTQLIFNDDRVKQHFQGRFWACISDKLSGLKELIGKVLRSMMDGKDEWHTRSLENLQSKLRDVVKEKQFLLVLDDIWDEHGDWLNQLRDLLSEAKLGSVVVVTSRSEIVASSMGTVKPYKLKGLTEDQAWALFRSLAFREGQEEECPNLATIGREITKKCGNVPLAIRTIARLLLSKDTEQEWLHFKEIEIGMIDQDQRTIMPTLELSYHHLSPQLKQCFAYCSLYPKDYQIEIQDLICRWLAQGYINSLDDGHAYFMELLRRCFFQDVRDEFGIMVSCKLHDLMHDLALSVGDECLIVDKPVEKTNSNFRHVTLILDREESLIPVEAPWLLASQPARSFYLPLGGISDINAICLHLRQLRVLDLCSAHMYPSLPNSIRKLKHLRYLTVGVDYLPEGITRLQNLQTLKVSTYKKWKELPRGFTKLTSLRHLMISSEYGYPSVLDDMPPGFGQLKHLETLKVFVVGKNNGLDALSGMNLAGQLKIVFKENRQNVILEAKAANLKAKKLTRLTLSGSSLEEQSSTQAGQLLRFLLLPATLKALEVEGFKMVRLSWEIVEFPNIVSIDISNCAELQYLPSFGGLPHLKKLRLWALRSLEYVEATSLPSTITYFPSLEELELGFMDNLQGWSEQRQQLQHFFPKLISLRINWCGRLKSLPWSMFAAQDFGMPLILERLVIDGCEELDLWVQDSNGSHVNNFSTWRTLSNLRSLILWGNPKLQSLPSDIGCLTQLQSIELLDMDNLKTLTEGIGHLIQLRSLNIKECPKLEALPESIRTLTALQRILISKSPLLARRCKEGDGEDWPLIQHISDIDIRA